MAEFDCVRRVKNLSPNTTVSSRGPLPPLDLRVIAAALGSPFCFHARILFSENNNSG
jgi:hypothetical protein